MKTTLFIIIQSLFTTLVLSQSNQVYIPYKKGALWSLANTNGEVLFPPKFDETFPSNCNLIRFRKGQLYGFITPLGKIVIDPIYQEAKDFNGLDVKKTAYVTLNDTSFFIDSSGTTITPIYRCGGDYSNISNGLQVYQVNGLYGIQSLRGDTLAKPIYKSITNDHNSLFVIAQNNSNMVGLIDWKGDIIHPFNLDSVVYDQSDYHLRYYKVFKKNKVGAVSLDGQILAEPKYDKLVPYQNHTIQLCFKTYIGETFMGYVFQKNEFWGID